MRVIIVGGGIGGLTLANSLQHANIDYVLIERRECLDPPVGASVGILSNGARLLDQLGCYDDMADIAAGMEKTFTHREDGRLIGSASDSCALMRQRTGYSLYFLERQYLLRVLAKHIRDEERVMLGKSVQRIDQGETQVTITCADGTSVEGDIVVGSDGTYSMVRREMWRQADMDGQGNIFEQDRAALTASYQCLFGISNSVPTMRTGETDRTYGKGISTLSYVGNGGKIFWFVFRKMDQLYRLHAIPKFSQDDAERMVGEIGNLPIREHARVTVRDLYRARVVSHLVAIEEAEYTVWSYGRVVCMGDSIHKMTPNLGAGATSAMEDAAVLSNLLVKMQASKPTASSIRHAFEQYQLQRQRRVQRIMRFSNQLTRVQTLVNNKAWFYTHYIAPRMDDFAAEAFSGFVIGAPLFEHLPVPERSLQGTMPFNPAQGWGYEESWKQRAISAWTLVVLAASAWQHPPSTQLEAEVRGDCVLLQIFTCLSIVESTRRSNKGSLIEIWLLYPFLSVWFDWSGILPLYLFLLYVQSPIQNFRSADGRLTDVTYTRTAGILLAASYSMHKLLNIPLHQTSWTTMLQPSLVASVQLVTSRLITPSTIQHDRLFNARRDVKWVRGTAILASLAAVASFAARLVATFHQSVSRDGFEVWALLISSRRLQYSLSAVLWLCLSYRDFWRAGMVEWPLKHCCMLLAGAVMGPETVLTVGWWWREEILIQKKHKDAVVS